MEDWQKEVNQEFFEMVILKIKENGIYAYPAAQQIYTVRNGKLYGTKEAIEIIKDITPIAFHSKLVVETEH